MAKEKVIKIGETEYLIVTPSIAQTSSADMEYSKAYSKALGDGIMPRQALERKLVSMGAWSSIDEELLAEYQENLDTSLRLFAASSSKEDKEKHLLAYYRDRDVLLAKSYEKEALFLHTAEAKGEEAKIIDLMWQCVVKPDRTRVWETKAAFIADSSESIATIFQEFVSFIRGLDQKIEAFDSFIKSSFESVEVEPVIEAEGDGEESKEVKKKDKKSKGDAEEKPEV